MVPASEDCRDAPASHTRCEGCIVNAQDALSQGQKLTLTALLISP